jgi:hypothetical protein
MSITKEIDRTSETILNLPQFSSMRITVPLQLQPIIITPLKELSIHPNLIFSKEILDQIGVNSKSDSSSSKLDGFFDSLGCLSCQACKAISK